MNQTLEMPEESRARDLMLRSLLIALAGAAIVVFAIQVSSYSVNIPAWDDYDAALNFMLEFFSTHGWREHAAQLFAAHNEHRIFFNRVCLLIVYFCTGAINFKILVVLGNLALAGCVVTIAASFKNEAKESDAFLAALVIGALVVLNPQYAEGMLWTTATLSIFPATFFSLLTLAVAQRGGKWHAAGALLAFLSAYTLASGVFAAPAALVMLLLQKRWRESACWAAITAAVETCFFWDFVKPEGHPSIQSALETPLNTLIYFLTYVGASCGFSDEVAAPAAGAVMLGIIAWIFFSGRASRRILPFSMLLLLIGTGAANALTRAPLGIMPALGPGRYRIVSTLALMLCLLFVREWAVGKWGRRAAAVFPAMALAYCSAAYWQYQSELRQYREQLVLGIVNWGVGNQQLTYPWFDRGNDILVRSLEKHYYVIPEKVLGEHLARRVNIKLPARTNNLLYSIDRLVSNERYVFAWGWAFIQRSPGETQHVYIVLVSAKTVFAFEAKPYFREDLVSHFRKANRGLAGFSALMSRTGVEPGEYRIGIYVVQNDRQSFQLTRDTVTLSTDAEPAEAVNN
jgi:hypothetical protein